MDATFHLPTFKHLSIILFSQESTDIHLRAHNIIAESLQLLQLYAPIFRFNQLPTQFILAMNRL